MLGCRAELLEERGRLRMRVRLGLEEPRLVAGHREIERCEAGSGRDIQANESQSSLELLVRRTNGPYGFPHRMSSAFFLNLWHRFRAAQHITNEARGRQNGLGRDGNLFDSLHLRRVDLDAGSHRG